jgi:hypothetical protein
MLPKHRTETCAAVFGLIRGAWKDQTMPLPIVETLLAAWCDTIAVLRDLPIDKGERAEIIANLRIIAHQIALVESVALDDLAEPAAVFRA